MVIKKIVSVLFICLLSFGWTWEGGWDNGMLSGDKVSLDVTNFNEHLSSADTTVQKALETLDNLVIPEPDLSLYVQKATTLTINGVSQDLSSNRSWTIDSMIYPDAGIAVSTGTAWGTSITDNSSNWNTAYGWGNHADAGYITTESDPKVGTITAGYIPKGNGAILVDSAIYENGGNAGINLSSPSVPLVVYTSNAYSAGSGGTITTYTSGGTVYKVHSFTSLGNATFVAPSNAGNLTVLVVAGGGGGGGFQGGGGGAGGVVYTTTYSATNGQSISLSVGDGGNGGSAGGGNGSTGGNSTFGTITAYGGGSGGGIAKAGGNGGSGGAPGGSSTTAGDADYISPRQGYDSGVSSASTGAAGGGGASAVGSNGTVHGPGNGWGKGGTGGNGTAYAITGISTYYGGGGAGGTYSESTTATVSGGLGGGGSSVTFSKGTAGTSNTGGGGGGGAQQAGTGWAGGKGGSGVVIVSYVEPASSPVSILNGSVSIGKTTSAIASILDIQASGSTTGLNLRTTNNIGTQLFAVTDSGSVSIGDASPTARLLLPAGTTSASTAPLKFTTGTSMTNAEAGAMEYTTDDLFFTIGTGTARKRLLMADPVGGLTSTRVPFATTNGRLTDDSDMTFATDTLTATKIVGTASVTSASIVQSSGGSSGKSMCWKTATTFGYCSSAVGADGTCTCN